MASFSKTTKAALAAACLGAAFLIWSGLRPSAPQDRAIGPLATGQGIAVLGTSLSHEVWPAEMMAALAACGIDTGPLVQVTRPGANSRWGQGVAADVVAAAPALVLVEFAVNDADITDGLSRADSRAVLRSTVRELQSGLPEAQVALMVMSPARGIKRLTRPFLAGYEAVVREVAAETGAGLIDLAPRWAAYLGSEAGQGALPDGLHPTAEAVRDVALPVITQAVAAGFGRDCGG